MQLFRKQPQEQKTLNLSTPVEEGVERTEAIDNPLALSLETLSKQTAFLIKKSKSQEIQVVYSMVALLSAIFVTVCATALMQHRNFPEPQWFNSYFPPIMFVLGCLPGLKLAGNIAWRQKRGTALVKEILLRERPDSLPLLIDIWISDCTNKRAARRIREALTTLLPQVREEDASHFKARHIQHLNALLMRFVPSVSGEPLFDVALRTAVVRALAYVGDEQSLERLTKLNPSLKTSDTEFFNTVAEVIPILELRVQKLKEHGTLLRASSEPIHSDTLLRPAYHSPQEPAQELLRPLDAEGADV